MDRFPDGVHVWLRSPVRGAYVFADDDGSGVSLSTCREVLNAAWQVQRVFHDGMPCILLQSAAYGRYLALSPHLARHGHQGRDAIMRDFDKPQQRNLMWRAISAGDGSDEVVLCTTEAQGRYLRAHGGRKTCWCITIDWRRSTMAHWTVEKIPPRPAPPALPAPSTDLGGRTDWERRIRYTRANDEGNFLSARTFKFMFLGRSVFNLRKEVAKKVGVDMFAITLCVHAGFYGRLSPLVVDLPRSKDPLDIVVLSTSSSGTKAFVHPDIGPPSPSPGIDLLTDGSFVRLKCRVRGRHCYLHAQGDGLGVNLSEGAPSLNDVWAVQQHKVDGDEFLLFRGAAYGRYFALMPEVKMPGSRFAQVNYEDQEQSNLLWVATVLKESDKVSLTSGNGHTGLGVPWTVEVVPMITTPPLLPVADPAVEKEPDDNTIPKPLKRIIWYRQGDDTKVTNHWTTLVFKGKSSSVLRSLLFSDSSLILCIRAGRCGQLTPLITDLPNNEETLEIIMLKPGSPAAAELRYPAI